MNHRVSGARPPGTGQPRGSRRRVVFQPLFLVVLAHSFTAMPRAAAAGEVGEAEPFELKSLYKAKSPPIGDEALFNAPYHAKDGSVDKRHPFLALEQYEQIRQAGLDVLQQYPGHLVIAPGRSMTALAAFLQNLNPDLAVNVPVSGLKKGKSQWSNHWIAHLDHLLLPVMQRQPTRPLLVVDRSSKGGTILAQQQILQNWLQVKKLSLPVEILSFDRHPEHKGRFARYNIENMPAFNTPQLWEDVAQYPYHLVGQDATPRARRAYTKLMSHMRARMVRDPDLDRFVQEHNKKLGGGRKRQAKPRRKQ